ncbi:hypothetical protein KFZ58_15485 [Virgibacillus sp. NKC19-16]|uniref:hypothetical protein n=1 Tax=Virgibacillus salidurans TaxID=2831673 RepID=UPI001F25741F|nr:hypothetical protein [Virgibacillus sp. NKC19-16]UJL45770.1 hypothetical protein KFZ58_15485 [Virgibacillus sp. NKC19-16]
MNQTGEESFEVFFKQHQHRIHYHIHDLDIKDPQNEFYVEGICALFYYWKMQQAEAGMDLAYFDIDSIIRVRLIALWDRRLD